MTTYLAKRLDEFKTGTGRFSGDAKLRVERRQLAAAAARHKARADRLTEKLRRVREVERVFAEMGDAKEIHADYAAFVAAQMRSALGRVTKGDM